ncbi:unnamed protein product, partial [Didymodactylos carnosus]
DDGRGGEGTESSRGDPREVDFSKVDEVRSDDEEGCLRGDPRDGAKGSPSPTSGRDIFPTIAGGDGWSASAVYCVCRRQEECSLSLFQLRHVCF